MPTERDVVIVWAPRLVGNRHKPSSSRMSSSKSWISKAASRKGPPLLRYMTVGLITMFNGKTFYFDWAIFNNYVSHYQRVSWFLNQLL